MRNRTLITLCGLALALQPTWATCGGGGGGGRGGSSSTYKTSWTNRSFDELLKTAKSREQGFLVYFAPKGTSTEHRFFATKIPNDDSKKRYFFKAAGDEGRKLREVFSPAAKYHAVLICDYYGNVMRDWKAKEKSKFSGKSIHTTLFGVEKQMKRLAKKIERKVGPAEKNIEKGNWPAAIKALQPYLAYKGYEGADKARKLWAEIEKAGEDSISEALRFEEKDAREKQLKEIKRKFKGTNVVDRCDEELGLKKKDKEKKKGDKDSQSIAPADEVWNEIYGGVDWSSPLAAEQVDAALAAGLAHENAGRYDQALKSYARAASLDANDPVPLVYLGELHRHHLGRWDDAQKAFARVVALDNDDHAVAVALHGIGKMTIWRGDNKKGLELFHASIKRQPTPLCYRNLAVYWYTEGEIKRAFGYATRAFELDPRDSYNQVFFAVHLLVNGHKERAAQLIKRAEFDVSMSYNYACYYAVRGERDLVLKYLKRHFFEYESCDAVRSFEMAEARMDAFFKPWYKDAQFVAMTALAGQNPWLR